MISKNTPKTSKALSRLGSIGGNTTFRKVGKKGMRKLVTDYWKSPAGQARRAAAKAKQAKAKGRKLSEQF